MLVATSKDVWPSGSFLQSWVLYARKVRFGARGSQASRKQIEEVNAKVQDKATASVVSVKQAVLELAYAEYAEKDLEGIYAQTYDACNFAIRDRCCRGRVTFGFNWVYHESNPNTVDSERVRDFEGL